MKRISILAALAAAAIWSGTASAGEKIKLPTANGKAQVTTAVQHGTTPITKVDWVNRAGRRGYLGYNVPGYYSTYRPYYGYSYGYPYGGYYTRPYYGYSYYGPGAYIGAPGVGVGVGPFAYRAVGPVWW